MRKWVANGYENEISLTMPILKCGGGLATPLELVHAFLPFCPHLSPVFHYFVDRREKNDCQNLLERERKERFPFFLPFIHLDFKAHACLRGLKGVPEGSMRGEAHNSP